RSLSLSSVQILVLDEADRMLDLGFIHALRRIVTLLPRQRQTLLFSATMPRPIAALAENDLTEPVRVVVAPPATTVERVAPEVVFVPGDRKRDLLARLLRDPLFERVLVFTRTKHGADRVVRHLASAGFRDGQTQVLVATAIAARHRIGRTARAGAHQASPREGGGAPRQTPGLRSSSFSMSSTRTGCAPRTVKYRARRWARSTQTCLPRPISRTRIGRSRRSPENPALRSNP